MTDAQPNQYLLSQMETLIELLRMMLDRDGHPLAERLDQFLSEITQIERAMTLAADSLTRTVPKIEQTPTLSDLKHAEERLFAISDEVAERLYRLETRLDLLFHPAHGAGGDG